MTKREDDEAVAGLPQRGEIRHDDHGLIVCHLCGRAFDLLPSHTRPAHGLTADEYRAEFGLGQRAALCSTDLSDKRARLQLDRLRGDPRYRRELSERMRTLGEISGDVKRRRRASVDLREQTLRAIRVANSERQAAGRWRGWPPPPRKRTWRECSWCGVPFLPVKRERGRDRVDRWRVTTRKTCSGACLSALRSALRSAEASERGARSG